MTLHDSRTLFEAITEATSTDPSKVHLSINPNTIAQHLTTQQQRDEALQARISKTHRARTAEGYHYAANEIAEQLNEELFDTVEESLNSTIVQALLQDYIKENNTSFSKVFEKQIDESATFTYAFEEELDAYDADGIAEILIEHHEND